MSADPDETYELAMPFISCESVGGPYADAAFVAGYQCGLIDEHLDGIKPETLTQVVDPGVVPQLDLIAMRRGYTMKSEPWEDHPDEWAFVTFERLTP